MRLPKGWNGGMLDTWIHNDARADIVDSDDRRFFVAIEGPNRATKEEAEADLERMVWALEGEDIAMVRADRDKALTRADLSDKALDYARKEIADLRAEIGRMEARESRRQGAPERHGEAPRDLDAHGAR